MKVLVATATADGELVRIWDCPDRRCRCTGFTGVETRRLSSTAVVVERADLDPARLRAIFDDSLRRAEGGDGLTDEEVWELSAEDVLVLMDQVRDLEPGTVVGRPEWCGPVFGIGRAGG